MPNVIATPRRKFREAPRPGYPIIPEALYRVKEAAGHFRRHPSTIWAWVKQGRLRAKKVGPNSTLITGESILSNEQAGGSREV